MLPQRRTEVIKLSEFQRSPIGSLPDKYTYIENGSKNRSGGLAQINVENKESQYYCCAGKSATRCAVFVRSLYVDVAAVCI